MVGRRQREDHYFTLRDRPEFPTGSRDSPPSTWSLTTPTARPVTCSLTRSLWAIDNGLCFHEEDKLRTVIWEYAGLAMEEPAPRAHRPFR